ncbi:MAG: 7,8-didemethyl-8-hydroxy-5-deazariboflavin synthase [Microbacterium sp. 71-36]|uniref:7,8-didemethyl-8-hydroxy-5-deazariboflavin synthase CofG n=1 Tax=unclassified Microbacterium TaxID=2609290 RepID=UPI0008696FD5|nr:MULTISPECIES: 7,8-didemethyl-8-hydroxy-5-deazariboflavin synthase CofG [unclassified Microbacterium]MBN9212855.1 7,8-didemethyl-8-hydroxy-5-deazariboflavin synthase CofG [Microbacterium sp.]ODT40282.1 MAG: 7,8-didemethyl-8-hydroxy-5-deazariboflavin synthase [Microbacterium sp. SCN 71-17]OJV78240.1 MAG: 7,8-didemethyl-8-hydroxy-5-deazariboflavin synthase [Microbacterium sp. 71-36]
MSTGSAAPQAAPARGDSIDDLLDRVRGGHRPDVDETEALLHAPLDVLSGAAAALRDEGLERAGRPGVITYSRKVFVPLTTLCRDRCHYCIFVDTPGQLNLLRKPAYMSPEQVLTVVRQGQALGCKEALLTLGDRPEERWPEARAWLDAHGFASTIDYVAHIARLITAETGMLVHANPGVMHPDELATLRPVSPSMGMMLETTSRRLYEEPGQVHFGSPDKDPDLRLRVIDDAGAAGIPFTTGILVGIGETVRDRAESLIALRDLDDRHGHVQEVIVQNFRAKPRTAMQGAPDADMHEYLATVAVARLALGPDRRIQVPPNLSDPRELGLLIAAGIDDWGGVSPLTADHVNPERPWPHIDDLATQTAAHGFTLRERLTAHPEYIRDAATWIAPELHAPVRALADATGLAADVIPRSTASVAARTADPSVRRLAEAAAADPLALDDADWTRLLHATGAELDALASAADDARRYTVGEPVTLVRNRNLTSTGFRRAGRTGAGEFDLADAEAIAADAADLGATEICIQGALPAEEDPSGYLDLVRAVKRGATGIHVHAFRPLDVRDLADRGGLGLEGALAAMREAGVDTVPGTGVKVLSERVRGLVAPGDLEIDRWVEGITAAHRAGFRSTSVLFYGHVETAAERIAHLRMLRSIQAETRGFAEFVPIPLPGGDVPLVAGRSPLDEHRAMVAVSRLLLSGAIAHVQIPWTRVGRESAAVLLRSGGDDLGGTLYDGRVLPDTGIEQGLELPVPDAERLARSLMRPFRLRTTDYGVVPA